MDKWESMYRILAQAVEDAIERLIEAENEVEDIYLSFHEDTSGLTSAGETGKE